MPAHQALISALREELATRADAEKACGMQAYMKSAMPYRGVQMPAQRELYGAVASDVLLADVQEWQATIRGLWYEARFREERYLALRLAGDRRYRAFRTPCVVPLYEELIVDGAWWDLVDDLATHLVAELLRAYPGEVRPVVLRWSRADDHWLRRTSIICQVGARGAADVPLLFECIAPSLGERDFFLRKAIGWALRDLGRTAPEIVREYVRANDSALSSLSKREALRHLQSEAASV